MGLCQYVDLCFHYPYLVCILFGMPSLHLFTFLMFFKSCSIWIGAWSLHQYCRQAGVYSLICQKLIMKKQSVHKKHKMMTRFLHGMQPICGLRGVKDWVHMKTAKMMQDFNCYCNLDVNHKLLLLFIIKVVYLCTLHNKIIAPPTSLFTCCGGQRPPGSAI